MERLIYGIAILCLLSACKRPIINSELVVMNEKSLEQRNNISLIPDLIEEWHYIPLETNDNALISEIGDLKVDQDYIFVFSENFSGENTQIMVFDKKGTFLNHIGSIGRGPGEYIRIGAWTVNSFDQEVVMLDKFLMKIIKYDYHGKYINEIKVDKPFLLTKAIYYIDKENILVKNCINNQDNHDYVLYAGNFSHPVSISTNDVTFYGHADPMKYSVARSDERILIMKYFCDTIFSLENKRLVPQYYIDMNHSVPHDFSINGKEYDYIIEKLHQKKCHLRNAFWETKNYILLPKADGDIIWDKAKQKGIIYQNNYYLGDMIWPTRILGVFDDWLIGVKNSDILLAEKEILLEEKKKLIPLYDCIRENDNPVLLLYKLKNNILDN